MESEVLFQFLDEYLDHGGFEDYPTALNGLQVQGPEAIRRVAVAVDGTAETIRSAIADGADLLLVHHGIFWDGFGPVTGRRHTRVATAITGGLAIYASHLPLDAHPEVGNSAILARQLGIVHEGTFGEHAGRHIGVWGALDTDRDDLVAALAEVVDGPTHMISGGPGQTRKVGVVTGGGSSMLGEAAAIGLDTLVTGEAPHHAAHEADERGMNLLLGGHYATETFGVIALAGVLEERFGLPWSFIDRPTGL